MTWRLVRHKQGSKMTVQLVKANLTNETEVKKLVSGILDKYESIDILINMIGAYLGG